MPRHHPPSPSPATTSLVTSHHLVIISMSSPHHQPSTANATTAVTPAVTSPTIPIACHHPRCHPHHRSPIVTTPSQPRTTKSPSTTGHTGSSTWVRLFLTTTRVSVDLNTPPIGESLIIVKTSKRTGTIRELHYLLDKVASVGTAPGPNSSDHNVKTITIGDGMPRMRTFRETIFPE
ncbi:hypothetical protein Tco_0835805 [Tanacetum coccineum]